MGLQGAVVSCAMLEECCQWWLLDTKALCGPGFRSMGIDTCVGVKIPNLQKLISTYRTHLAARGPAVCSLRKPAWPPVVPFGRQRPSSPAPGGPAHGESQGQLSPAMDPGTTVHQPSLFHHQLPEHTQTHVHHISDAIQPSHSLLSPSLPTSNLSQPQDLFK